MEKPMTDCHLEVWFAMSFLFSHKCSPSKKHPLPFHSVSPERESTRACKLQKHNRPALLLAQSTLHNLLIKFEAQTDVKGSTTMDVVPVAAADAVGLCFNACTNSACVVQMTVVGGE